MSAMDSQMKFWSSSARNAVPYTPGEQPKDRKFIKLNTNENPYGPSPRVLQLSPQDLHMNLYPEPTAYGLRKVIAEMNSFSPEEIFVGNGSDEVLAFAFGAFGDEDHPFSFPDITYSFYPVWSDFYHVSKRIFPLGEDFSIDLTLAPEDGGPLVIANPNAPTGIALPSEVLVNYLETHSDRLMIVDEAYVDFGAESMVHYIRKFPNLLVVQTFSKSRALAGARLGFAFGQAQLIEAMNRIKDSFNSYTVSAFSQAAGIASYQDSDYLAETSSRIIATRERSKAALKELGFAMTDSMANFLWVTHPEESGQFLYEALRERGILVRHFSNPALTEYLRITVGTDDEMDELICQLKNIRGINQ